MQDAAKLNGKVAIVTGAGSSGPGVGTGKGISVLFAREGGQVVLVDKFEDRAKETLGLIEDEGGRAAVVTTSWGKSEAAFSADERNAIHQTLEEGAAQLLLERARLHV